MSQTREINLLVFDWDGTLVDSLSKIVLCLRSAGEELEMPHRTDLEFKQIIGLGLQEAVGALYPSISGAKIKEMAACYSKHYTDANDIESGLYQGVERTLAKLKESGYKLAVATGKSRRGLDHAFGDTQIAHYFDASRCADETASKPNPKMLFEILSELDVKASQSIMVGDTTFDLNMGHAAELDTVAIKNGAHSESQLKSIKPRAIFDTINEIPQWLNAAKLDNEL